MRKLTSKTFLLLITACIVILSCTRNEIQFGHTPENNYTNIVFTDTVKVSLSTLVVDSFVTSSATSLLLGKYSDPALGAVSVKNFFQLTVPVSPTTIPGDAVYDSVTFIFRPNEYYYGDTSLQQTIYVYEIAEAMNFSYNNSFYNTSNVSLKPVPLGSKTMRLRPVLDDSVEIRLNDAKGTELFAKLKGQSIDVTTEENFLNYFHGVSLVTANDLAAVYGINGTAGNMVIRIHYHTTIPQPANVSIDFASLANAYSFNQVIPDRTATGLISTGNNLTEIPSFQTNNVSFLQPGTGLYLKITFPSLRGILSGDKIIKLVKAELYVRPARLSFDKNKYKLPSPLYLNQTDASNVTGDPVIDTSGSGVLYAYPVTDDIYGENNYYRFNITPYINQLLTNSGTEGNGFYLMHDASASSMNVSRLIANNSLHENQSTKLHLYYVVINK